VEFKKMGEDSGRAVTWMWIGTAIFLIGLALPLFYIDFHPPGGSQILGGHRFEAFNFEASGYQFAKAAPWSRVLILSTALLAAAIIRTGLLFGEEGSQAVNAARALKPLVKCVHAIAGLVVAFGSLLAITLIILLSWTNGPFVSTPIVTAGMPVNGEQGILPSFENPLQPVHTFDTSYLSLWPGIGILFLVIGIVICLASLGKVAGYAFIGYVVSAIVVLIISNIFHNAALNDVLGSIRKAFFIT
jgi:hypothetical protein